MYQTTVTFPVKEWRKLRENLKNVPNEFQRKIQRDITAMTSEAVEEFEKYPPPVKTPIQWTSEKQRRWYFWSRGGFYGPARPDSFQRYVRTGRLGSAWRVLRQGNQYESTLTFSNDTPYLPYVMGKWQQRFHANTGWRSLRLLQDAIRHRVRRRITSLMRKTVDEATRNLS